MLTLVCSLYVTLTCFSDATNKTEVSSMTNLKKKIFEKKDEPSSSTKKGDRKCANKLNIKTLLYITQNVRMVGRTMIVTGGTG